MVKVGKTALVRLRGGGNSGVQGEAKRQGRGANPSPARPAASPQRRSPAMPNDARLGLVVGVTLVILVAVLFARRDGLRPGAGPVQATPAAAPVPGLPGASPGAAALVPGRPRSHTVEEGESLMTLAVRY